MKGRLSTLAMIFALALAGPSQAQQPGATVITSPAPLLQEDPRPRIFLAGSINMGATRDWQAEFAAALADLDVIVLNPRRADWDRSVRTEADGAEFAWQV